MSRFRRTLTTLLILGLMAGFGVAVNRYLQSRTTQLDVGPTKPGGATIAPQSVLPGTIYFADGGGIFALHGTRVSTIEPQGHGWTQPVLLPGGAGLLAVKITQNYYSDLYQLSLGGAVEKRLSHDSSATTTATDQTADDWIMDPAIGPDNTLYFAYDWPKAGVCDAGNGYQVDYSIWSTQLGSVDINRHNIESRSGITQQTWANYYTGGDLNPVPLLGGGLIYSNFEIANGGEVSTPVPGAGAGDEVSQIRLNPKVTLPCDVNGTAGAPLTLPGDDCSQPALNPAQTLIAMACSPVTNGQASSTEADLVVASFDAATGTLGPLHRLVTGTMVAVPSWSPDGRSLLYLAPEAGDGYFELWYLANAAAAVPPATPAPAATTASPGASTGPATGTAKPTATPRPTPAATPAAPRQLTSGLDIDATAAPAWSAT